MARLVTPAILHVMHECTGGLRFHVLDLVRQTRGRYRHYVLTASGGRWRVEDWSVEPPVERQVPLWARWGGRLDRLCRHLGVGLCHVHHLSGDRAGLLRAFAESAVPYGFTVHDFHLACPTIHLVPRQGRYCEATSDPGVCQRCILAHGVRGPIEIRRWRAAHAAFLGRARFVVAPAEWTARTFRRYFPTVQVTALPHRYVPPFQGAARPVGMPAPPITLGVLGLLGPEKGSLRLERLVELAVQRGLPLRWVVIGYTSRRGPGEYLRGALRVHGPYAREELPALLDRYGVSLVVFPAAGPETFSFTLTEAWATGRPVLVPPIGALGERVAAAGGGWVMENWLDEGAILEQILRIAGDEAQWTQQAAHALHAGEQAPADTGLVPLYERVLSGQVVGRYAE